MGQLEDEEERALLRLEARARLRSAGEEELSEVIEREALSHAPKSASTPAPVRGLVAVLNTLPSWGRVMILLAIVAACFGSGAIGSIVARVWR